MLYLIALLLFGVFCILWLMLQKLDFIILLLGDQADVIHEKKDTVTPTNGYSRHLEIVKAWRSGGNR